MMMTIDFHAHIFPDKIAGATIRELESVSGLRAATNGCLNGLLESMKEAGVDTSVIMPVVTAPRQFAGINRFAMTINEQYGALDAEKGQIPKLLSFGGIHPECEDYRAKLRELKNMGFRGIKLHPDYQKVFFDDIRYERIINYASELDMIVLVHAGIDIGLPEPVHCTPAMSFKVLKDTKAPRLILAHMGGWKQWEQVEELLIGQDVYLDTAFVQRYLPKEQFCRMVKNHGSERILFATDSPWTEQKEAVEWLQSSELTDEEKKNISFKNAKFLLGIN